MKNKDLKYNKCIIMKRNQFDLLNTYVNIKELIEYGVYVFVYKTDSIVYVTLFNQHRIEIHEKINIKGYYKNEYIHSKNRIEWCIKNNYKQHVLKTEKGKQVVIMSLI